MKEGKEEIIKTRIPYQRISDFWIQSKWLNLSNTHSDFIFLNHEYYHCISDNKTTFINHKI